MGSRLLPKTARVSPWTGGWFTPETAEPPVPGAASLDRRWTKCTQLWKQAQAVSLLKVIPCLWRSLLEEGQEVDWTERPEVSKDYETKVGAPYVQGAKVALRQPGKGRKIIVCK